MKILWHSNGFSGQSGYSNQTRLFTPMIHQRDEYDVIISATHGREFSLAYNDAGILELPRWLDDNWGNTIIDAHMQAHKRDVVISLIDPFVLTSEKWAGVNWCAWTPVDSAPVSPENLEALKRARWVWSMSRFGHEQLQHAGFDPIYVPHGVDTDVYKPIDRVKARETLGTAWGRDLDGRFVVVTVAANVGSPSRKNFAGMIDAFKLFHARHPESVWYIHTEPAGRMRGDNLRAMVAAAGLSDAVVFPADYNYMMGLYGPEYLNQVYNAADVFFLLSGGEGFGIPIVEAQAAGCPVVVTDGSAMAELCLAGGKVDARSVQAWMGRPGCRWWLADTESAAAHLDFATGWDSDKMRQAARESSLKYDKQRVFDEYMLPALARMADEIKKPRVRTLRIGSEIAQSTKKAAKNSADKYEKLGNGYHWEWAKNPANPYIRYVERVLGEFPAEGENKTVLDVGSGDGYPASLLAARGYAVTGVEPHEGARGVAVARVPDATFVDAVPVPDATFDYVLLLDVLEHIESKTDIERVAGIVRRCSYCAILSLPVAGRDEYAVGDWSATRVRETFGGCIVTMIDRTSDERLFKIVPVRLAVPEMMV